MFWQIGSAKSQGHEYLSTHLLRETAQLLASCVSPIKLVDELISLLEVLPKEMRMVGESKIFYFFICGVD